MLIKATFELEQAVFLEKNLILKEDIDTKSIELSKYAINLVPEWIKEAICENNMIVCSQEDFNELDPEVSTLLNIIRQ